MIEAHATKADEMPKPSAEMVLLRVFAEAYLATAHQKPKLRARAFLEMATEILATEESVAMVFPIRPTASQAEVSKARREAVAMYRQYMPLFFARLPRDDA